MLRPLQSIFPPGQFPDLLVGLESPDDAAVYRLNSDLALIFTADFFPPIVDDPYTYGAVAAANAMSDVYAMGGQVLMALGLAAFPSQMPASMVGEILRGAAEKVAEAGGVIAGGHTVDDDEPKYGLAVVGTVHPSSVMTKGGAQPGDVLLLTKPLGVGIITTAAKGGAADPAHLNAAIESMLQLNRGAAELAAQVHVHAMTDVTGYSLLGHGYEMAVQSGVRLRFDYGRIPFLPGAKAYADLSLFPGGSCRNQDMYAPHIDFNGLSDELQLLLLTPETSGGLLIALPRGEAGLLEALCAGAGQPVWRIGEVIEGDGIEIVG